jgi:FKBP-type peptidyl-prolyl cis-trans isomerase FklB
MSPSISSVSSSLAVAVLSILLDASAGAAAPPAANSATTAQLPASTPQPSDAASYSLGLSFATQWREGGMEGLLSEEGLIRGIRAGLAGSPLTDEDRQRASAFLHDAYEAWGLRNKSAATEFLSHNSKEQDVKTTATGLQYLVLAKGDPGPATTGANDRVTVQYRGRLLNGTEFDSSFTRGKPAVIRPSALMAGWREALLMMNRGASWRVFVPPDLAYGATPPAAIPPNALLVFDIEVLQVEHVGEAKSAPTAPIAPMAPTAPVSR